MSSRCPGLFIAASASSGITPDCGPTSFGCPQCTNLNFRNRSSKIKRKSKRKASSRVLLSKLISIENSMGASAARDGQDGFLDLGQSEVPDLFQVELRKVRQLVGNHNGIDNGGSVDGEGLADRRRQFVGMLGCKPVAAASPGEGGKVGIGKLDPLPEWREAHAFGLECNQSEGGIVEDHHLHR